MAARPMSEEDYPDGGDPVREQVEPGDPRLERT